MVNVKRENIDQNGFVPMLIVVLLVVVAVIYLVYTHVSRAQK